jgi:hypothetical protein
MNLNELAKYITTEEGLNEQVDITQVKEILGILGRRWRNLSEEQFLEEVNLIKSNAGKSREKEKGLFDEVIDLFRGTEN